MPATTPSKGPDTPAEPPPKERGRGGRAFLAAAVSVALLAPSGHTVAGGRGRKAKERPNVLVIVTDDQRLDTLHAMPATLDWLGAGGRTFTNAFATTPLCCPSRTSILTGDYAHNHRVLHNGVADRIADARTLPEALKRRGYLTGIAGKYLNGWDLERAPTAFDRWSVFKQGYWDAPFNIDGRQREVDKYTTDFVRDTAVELLASFERDDQRPWFLYVAPFAPHTPATPAPSDRGAQTPPWSTSPAVEEQDRSDKPPAVQSLRAQPRDRARAIRHRQLRALMAVDRMVAELRLTLSRLGEDDRTLAVFVSDNGYFWGEHGLKGKSLPYLEATRIPLLLHWPGRIDPGTSDTRLAANIDIAPTVMQAAGAAGESMDGRSLLEPAERGRILLEYWKDAASERVPSWAAITTPTVQYVEYYAENETDVIFREYYDLTSDPWQMTNLIGDADPSNDPPGRALSDLTHQLAHDRHCRGTAGAFACP